MPVLFICNLPWTEQRTRRTRDACKSRRLQAAAMEQSPGHLWWWWEARRYGAAAPQGNGSSGTHRGGWITVEVLLDLMNAGELVLGAPPSAVPRSITPANYPLGTANLLNRGHTIPIERLRRTPGVDGILFTVHPLGRYFVTPTTPVAMPRAAVVRVSPSAVVAAVRRSPALQATHPVRRGRCAVSLFIARRPA